MHFLTEEDHRQHSLAIERKRELLAQVPADNPELENEVFPFSAHRREIVLRNLIENLLTILRRNYVEGGEPSCRELVQYWSGPLEERSIVEFYDHGRGYAALVTQLRNIAHEFDGDLVIDIYPRMINYADREHGKLVGLDVELSLPRVTNS